MSNTLYCAAAPLRAMLKYIDTAEGGVERAIEDRQLAELLIKKVRADVGEADGSRGVRVNFEDNELDVRLKEQFVVIAEIMLETFRAVGNLSCKAAFSLRAMLEYIDSAGGPRIAYDNDALAEPLVAKVRGAVGGANGDELVEVSFADDEEALKEQFVKVANAIERTFESIRYVLSARG